MRRSLVRTLLILLAALLLLGGAAYLLRKSLYTAAKQLYIAFYQALGSTESPDLPIENEKVAALKELVLPDYITEDLIIVDGASRRGTPLEDITAIVIHYVGNPGTTAAQNRSYYNQPTSTVSSHFLVGLEGEILLCVPLHERSSASNHRNSDTISIEVCHPDDTGKFTDASYGALVKLTAFLLTSCDLDTEDVIRHYDVTGKECPRYFVRHEQAWEQFLADVEENTEH